MKRAAFIYIAMIIAMAATMTLLPAKQLPPGARDAANAEVAQAEVARLEVASMTAQDPSTLVVPDVADGLAAELAPVDPAVAAGSTAAALLAAPMTPDVASGTATGLAATTSAILAKLAIGPTTDPVANAALREMSAQALQSLRMVRGVPEEPPAASLENMVASALKAGKDDSYINTLVNEAVGRNEFTVPPEMVTPDGRVDTAVLLANLVTRAKVLSSGLGKPSVSAATNVPAGAEIPAGMVRTYTVKPGDSLGSIAQKFYGDIDYASILFSANRKLLSAPDQLRVGQQLLVPGN